MDFGPATRALARLVGEVRDDQLDGPTPCPDWTVADLMRHIGGLTLEFTASAQKVPTPARAAEGLTDGWRQRIQDDLAGLADAWTDPAAYEGDTHAGPVTLPGREAARVALNEVTVTAGTSPRGPARTTPPIPTRWRSAAGSSRSSTRLPTVTAESSARRWPRRTTRLLSTGWSASPAGIPPGDPRDEPADGDLGVPDDDCLLDDVRPVAENSAAWTALVAFAIAVTVSPRSSFAAEPARRSRHAFTEQFARVRLTKTDPDEVRTEMGAGPA